MLLLGASKRRHVNKNNGEGEHTKHFFFVIQNPEKGGMRDGGRPDGERINHISLGFGFVMKQKTSVVDL